MELLEEYLLRHKITEPVVRYPDKAQLLLTARSEKSQYRWLHLEIDFKQEVNKPPYFYFRVSANPTIYSTPDFNFSSCYHEKVVTEHSWNWDDFDTNITEWCKSNGRQYSAIELKNAIPICWKMFVINHDRWLANCLPLRMIGDLHASLFSGNMPESIMRIEEWMRDQHERAYNSWQAVRKNFDSRSYADWLAVMVNMNAN